MRHPLWLAILPTLILTSALGSVCLLTVYCGQTLMHADEARAWLLALIVAIAALGLTAIVGARRLLAPAFALLAPDRRQPAEAAAAFRSLNNFPGRYAVLMGGTIVTLSTLVTLAPLAVGGRTHDLGPFLACFNLAGSGTFALILFGRLPRVLQPVSERVAAQCGDCPLDIPGLTNSKPSVTWQFLMLGAVVLMLLYGIMGWLSGQGALFALVQAEVAGIVAWVSHDATVAQSRPAALLRDGLLAFGQENFEHRVPVSARDDFGMIAQLLNGLGKRLGGLIAHIRTGVLELSASNEAQSRFASESLVQVSQAVEHQAIGSSRIAELVDGMQQQIAAMATAIAAIARNADTMGQQTTESYLAVVSGTNQVSATLGNLDTVRLHVQTTAEAMMALERESQQIGAITATIAGIANQTNLLALNAAIEAARAGDHGRGFSVVADEVRKLSQSARDAVADIGGRVRAVQAMTTQTIADMDKLSRQVDGFSEAAQGTDAVLRQIEQASATESEQIQGISQAIAELVQQSDGISQGVLEVAAIVQESAAGGQQVTASTHEVLTALEQVSAMSSRLRQMVTELGRSNHRTSAPPAQPPTRQGQLLASGRSGQVPS